MDHGVKLKPPRRPTLRMPPFDFVARPRRAPWPAWLLMGCGLLMAVVSGLDVLAANDRLAAGRERLARLQAASERLRATTSAAARAASAGTNGGARATDQAAAREAAWSVAASLRHPWLLVFEAVEAATPAGVRWLGMDHDAGRPELRLEGTAPDAASALALVDALAADPAMAMVVLTRLDRAQDAAGVRFELSAQLQAPGWRGKGT
jgi:hypothetical protein